MDFKVKIAILAVVIPLVALISVNAYDELYKEPLIVENNGTLIIRTPVNEHEDRIIAEKLVDFIAQKYDDNDKNLESLQDSLVFSLPNDEIRYVFAVDDELTVIFHHNPDLMGLRYDQVSAQRSLDDVTEELSSNGKVWVHVQILNPNTGEIEPKTTLLKDFDGIIFGSGFNN